MFSRKRIYYNHNGNHILLTSYVRDNPRVLYRTVVCDVLCVMSIPIHARAIGSLHYCPDALRALVLNHCVCWGL